MSYAVYVVGERVDALLDGTDVLGLCIAREERGVHDIEIAVEGDEVNLLLEGLAHIRNIGSHHLSSL